jgi:hypothetical protein
MKNKCTKRIYPPGLAGIGSARDCGNPSKDLNAEGEPRCGLHSDAAYARRDAKRKADEAAERDRHARHVATYGGQVFLTPEERSIILALARGEPLHNLNSSAVLAQIIHKLEIRKQ